jgi:hypothetical protein
MDSGLGMNGQISRRDAIRRLVSGAGAGAFLAGTAVAHPIYKHLADGTLLAATKVSAESWKPLYLNPQQSATLQVLAERIIPNSTKAQVAQFIDLLLSVETADVQRDFDHSLAAFDQEANRRFGHPFKEISEANQNELLTAASIKPQLQEAPAHSAEDDDSADPNAAPANGRHTLYDHFENMKNWVRGAYYSSEFGMRELGWTGMVFHLEYHGCQHPEGHV